MLGDVLATAGVHRSVIANGDAGEGFEAAGLSPDTVDDRSAVATLMGGDGTVPGGTVSRSLLEPAPAAVYGVRLDATAVVSSFERAWSAPGRSVVLVETSDLLRAQRYAASTSGGQGSALRRAAVQASDELLGQVVAHADPEHDAVLVLSPVSTSATQLSVALLSAPGLSGGLLRSATTRRAGYVELADVTPTVFGLFGLRAPVDIEGRPFQVSPAATAGRVARLVHQGEAARFRDGVLPTTVTLTIVLLVLLLAAGLLGRGLGTRFPGRLRPLVAPWALAMLGVVPATYIAGRIAAARAGTAPFLAAVAAGAAAVGLVGWAVERRRRGLGAIAVVGTIVAMFAVDVVIGAPLQLNTVFGYSVAVAGRFTGLGNLAFALFGASVVVLAALVVDRYPRTGLRWALGLLGLGILVEGLPMLGADVGGVLAMVPAFGLTALLLAGRRPRWTHLVGLATAAGVTVVAFAFIDKARPAGCRPTWPDWPSAPSTASGATSSTRWAAGSTRASAERTSPRGWWSPPCSRHRAPTWRCRAPAGGSAWCGFEPSSGTSPSWPVLGADRARPPRARDERLVDRGAHDHVHHRHPRRRAAVPPARRRDRRGGRVSASSSPSLPVPSPSRCCWSPPEASSPTRACSGRTTAATCSRPPSGSSSWPA